jgi:thiamine biosynthesis lipoprotein
MIFSMDTRRILPAAACTSIVLMLAYAIFGTPSTTERVFVGQTMGTAYNIRVVGCIDTGCETLREELEARLTSLSTHLSHYDPESELSAFNRYTGSDWFPVSNDLYSVVAYSKIISKRSDGLFDITVAPAVNAWGFGPENNQGIPDADTLREAVRRSGHQKLGLRSKPFAFLKQSPDLTLDLSAIAKGYAVDQLALIIEAQGFDNFLVEIGGEIRASGMRSDGRSWRIGLEPPDTQLPIEYIVTLQNESIASSGDYRNFFTVDEKRYSHTLDPRTGWPVDHSLAGVSIIQPSAMQADVMATLLMVLGPEQGLIFAEANKLPALFFLRGPTGTTAVYTKELQPYLLSD